MSLRVPGSAALEPQIQEEVRKLDEVLKEQPEFQQDDWNKLLHILELHSKSLLLVDTEERQNFLQDIKEKSGWWKDGKINPHALKATLARKTGEWTKEGQERAREIKLNLHKSGVYVFLHEKYEMLQYVGTTGTSSVLDRVLDLLEASYNGKGHHPLHTALLLSRAEDWAFYSVLTENTSEQETTYNQLVIEHDALWPCGLNDKLKQSPACLQEFNNLREKMGGINDLNLHIEVSKKTLEDLGIHEFLNFLFYDNFDYMYKFDKTVQEFYCLIQTFKNTDEKFDFESIQEAKKLCWMMSRVGENDSVKFRSQVRSKSRWWGKEDFSEGPASLDGLVDTLGRKMKLSATRKEVYKELQKPGVFYMQNTSHPCFQFVSLPCEDILKEVRKLLNTAYDGLKMQEHEDNDSALQSAMLVTTRADDWQFGTVPADSELQQAIDYNHKVITKGTLWPHGGNFHLIDNWKTMPDIRKSLGIASK